MTGCQGRRGLLLGAACALVLGGCATQVAAPPASGPEPAVRSTGPFAPGQEPFVHGGGHPALPDVTPDQQIIRSFHASGRCDDFAPAYGCWITEIAELDAAGVPQAVLEQHYLHDAERGEWRLWRVLRYPLGPPRLLFEGSVPAAAPAADGVPPRDRP